MGWSSAEFRGDPGEQKLSRPGLGAGGEGDADQVQLCCMGHKDPEAWGFCGWHDLELLAQRWALRERGM